jgi:hypothetical protein
MHTPNLVAMGEVGLSGVTAVVLQPVVDGLARATGRPERDIKAVIGAGLLLMTVIGFVRTVEAVIQAGRTTPPKESRHQ